MSDKEKEIAVEAYREKLAFGSATLKIIENILDPSAREKALQDFEKNVVGLITPDEFLKRNASETRLAGIQVIYNKIKAEIALNTSNFSADYTITTTQKKHLPEMARRLTSDGFRVRIGFEDTRLFYPDLEKTPWYESEEWLKENLFNEAMFGDREFVINITW